MAFAGLWDVWTGEDGTRVASCCVITTEANELVRGIHARMPVIIPPADFDRWLDSQTPKDVLAAMLRPYPANGMEAYPVRQTVNKATNEGPELVEPAA
jgi:putative SOS response-associated peptidase YedK